jgi:hypothetical protein
MEAPNRDIFVANVVAFVKKYNLDGVDFDWEYPGEPDMEIIPPGTAEEGLNYFLFLNSLRSSLPAGISLSIAAPAGYVSTTFLIGIFLLYMLTLIFIVVPQGFPNFGHKSRCRLYHLHVL